MDMLFTWLLRLFCWGTQLAGVLLMAFLPTCLLGKNRKKQRFRLFALLLIVEILILTALSNYPPVLVPEAYSEIVSQEQRQDISAVSSGLYSGNIPLIPLCAQVTYADEQTITWNIQYLFWGSMEMYLGPDGFSILKPLSLY